MIGLAGPRGQAARGVACPTVPRDRRLLVAAAVAILAVVLLVLLLRGGGDDDTVPARRAADPLTLVPARADATFDLDLRVPLVAVVTEQVLRDATGARSEVRVPLGARGALADRGARRWIAVQIDPPGDAGRTARALRGRSSTRVSARDGVLLVSPAGAPAASPRPTARAAFERRLARLPRRSGARVALDAGALIARFSPRLAATPWGRALTDGAAALVVRGAKLTVPFRLTSRAVPLADLPIAPGRTAAPARGAAPITVALRDPAHTLAVVRDAGLIDGLSVIDRLPGFLRPDLTALGPDGTLTTTDRRTVTIRVTPRDPGDWSRKLDRLDALSGLARRLGIADVRIDRDPDGAYRLDQHGRFALRVGIVGRALVLSTSRTADLRAAAAAPGTPPPADAAGALTATVAPSVIYDELDRRFRTELPRDVVRLGPLTAWVRSEPRVTAGELRLRLSGPTP